VTDKYIEELINNHENKDKKKNTGWAVGVFEKWRNIRNTVPISLRQNRAVIDSGFAAPTLGRHISTFRGYRILCSIRNPYIHRFTNYFSIHS
jgi:3-methyladenine DNA glycosylase AlkC